MNQVTVSWTSEAIRKDAPKEMVINDDEFDKILSMAISALNRLDDRSPMENRALSVALRLEMR